MQRSINPATGRVQAEIAEHEPAAIDAILNAAVTAQYYWRSQPVEARTDLLRRLATVLRRRSADLAALITREMGKPIAEAEGEIEKCAWNCNFYADHAPRFLGEEAIDTGHAYSGVVYEPLGVVLAIMPWNYPLWQFFRFAAPALAAGNGAILKHANNVPQCALAIETVMREAGCPDGLVRTVLIEPDRVASVIADDRIAAVTLTGSTEVGAIVAAQAGKALKKQVLELGGSDPFVVLEDADIDQAAQAAVKSRFINVGQSCVNAKRFLVVEAVADRFVEAMRGHVAALVVGDPTKRSTQIGPMARANLRDTLARQVDLTVAAGATLVIGGGAIERDGYYFAPTLLDHVTAEMVAAREETFGPVAAVIRVADAEEAIAVANATEYGLAATIWTADASRGRAMARRIDAGAVFINAVVASDPRLPFGGIKRSGYGRELGVAGIREFTNIKTICVGPVATN